MNNTERTSISIIAKIGFVAKGMVYFTVGLLALQAAIGISGQPAGTKEAVREFLYQPFGMILLIFCIGGLLAHAIWRILQSIVDPEDRGGSTFTKLFRVVDFLTGLLYISFSYAAWQILQGLGTQSSDETTEVWVGKILVLPYGRWIVLFCALVILITGFYQFYAAYRGSFDYSFDKTAMSDSEITILRQFGRIGFSAWGIVYLMISYMFYQAAIYADQNEAGGLAEALSALGNQPYGFWILAVTSVGLIIYGIYLLVLSYYHKI